MSMVVCATLVATACTTTGGPEPASSGPVSGDPSVVAVGGDPVTPQLDPADLPVVATAVPVTGTDPVSRAAELVAATADELADVGPGWTAVYAEFGVPIVDDLAVEEPEDPVGPLWSQVWSIGQMSRGTATIPLPDVVRAITQDTGPLQVDPQRVLDDLRIAAASDDPQSQTLARFIAGKSVASGLADPLDPAATVESIGLDAATVQLMTWAALRAALVQSTAEDVAAGADPSITSSRGSGAVAEFGLTGNFVQGGVGRGAGKIPCSAALGDSALKAWTVWVLNKASGGVNLPGASTVPGIVERLVKKVAESTQGVGPAARLGSKVGGFITYANLALSLLSVLAQINALQIDVTASQPPLVRRKDIQPGSNQNLDVSLYYSFKALDINNPIACTLSYLANISGIGLTIPEDGAPVPGSRMIARTGKNMPSRIEFASPNSDGQAILFTDEAGKGTVEVRGSARAKAIPGSPEEKRDEFSVAFSAQVEEAGVQSALNVLIDTAGVVLPVAVAGPGGLLVSLPSAVSLAIDFVKLMQIDIGTKTFPFTDWEAGGWRIDEPSEGTNYRFTAAICDLDAPFTIFENEAAVFGFTAPLEQATALDFVPTGDGNGTYTFTDQSYLWFSPDEVQEGLIVEGEQPAYLVYTVPDDTPGAVFLPSPFPGILPDRSFTLIPDPTVCDLPPDTRQRVQVPGP